MFASHAYELFQEALKAHPPPAPSPPFGGVTPSAGVGPLGPAPGLEWLLGQCSQPGSDRKGRQEHSL